MQHHELKKYLKFTMSRKPDKMKKYKRFAHETTGIFFKKCLLLKNNN